jgi:NAD(P)-dependent dehydrogenase (short-subunit alcohol dehydrogenase family)
MVAKAFPPNRNPNASLVAVSSAAIAFSVKAVEGSSSYVASKLATIKPFEFIAAEYLDVQVVTVHPGVVDMALNSKSEFEGLPMDDGKHVTRSM